jgi:hypothetical protein
MGALRAINELTLDSEDLYVEPEITGEAARPRLQLPVPRWQ